MERVLEGYDINGDYTNTAAIHGCQQVADEFGHVVFRFDHGADGDHPRAMALPELCGPQFGV